MVLEAFYESANLRQHQFLALPLGFLYTCIGIGLSYLIFPGNVGLASVAFTSILMMPSLVNLVVREEEFQRKGRKLSLITMMQDYLPVVKVYLNLFLGSFFAYIVFSMLLSGSIVPVVFSAQFGGASSASLSGAATFDSTLFSYILVNNMVIVFLCFFISFLFGNGAIFFITWNASVWGVFFGNLAVRTAQVLNNSPLSLILTILVVVITFVIIEALAYIMAAVSGSVLSKSVLKELKAKELTVYHKYAAVVGALSSKISRRLLEEKWYAEGFSRVVSVNMALLALAILALIIGGVIETAILENVGEYQVIRDQYEELLYEEIYVELELEEARLDDLCGDYCGF